MGEDTVVASARPLAVMGLTFRNKKGSRRRSSIRRIIAFRALDDFFNLPYYKYDPPRLEPVLRTARTRFAGGPDFQYASNPPDNVPPTASTDWLLIPRFAIVMFWRVSFDLQESARADCVIDLSASHTVQ